MPHETDLCAICELPASHFYYGVFSCRACAEFFRRSVDLPKNPKVKCNGKCEIVKKLRKLCKECRFEKCLKVGMRKNMRIDERIMSGSSILSVWQSGYQNLQNARSIAFRQKPYNHVNCFVLNDIYAMDNKLITNDLLSGIPAFQILKISDKNFLLSQFLARFVILEGVFKASRPHQFYFPNGDRIEDFSFEEHYEALNQTDTLNQRAVLVFSPYWRLQNRIIREALDDVVLDKKEFAGVVALILWDIDFHQCSEQLALLSTQQRKRILEELCVYEKSKNKETSALRIAKIMMILPVMQKTLSMIMEMKEVSTLYGLDAFHTEFLYVL